MAVLLLNASLQPLNVISHRRLVVLLTKERVAAGAPPESGLLTNRKDLTVDFIKVVVRRGKLAMPRLTRVDVTDAELDAIAHYLGKPGE